MISTKGRYALRVLIDLAEHGEKGYVSLKDIAARQGISKKYLEAIMRELVRGQIVFSAGGRNGGYALSRKPKDYTVGEVLELLEGSLASVACLTKGAPACERAAICKTLPMWEKFDEMVSDFFSGITLEDLL